jgi:hypothetical protein
MRTCPCCGGQIGYPKCEWNETGAVDVTDFPVASLLAEYAERLHAVSREEELDALWAEMVAEPAERMSDADFRYFVVLDDRARRRVSCPTVVRMLH